MWFLSVFLFLFSFQFVLFFHCAKICCKRGMRVDNWLRFGQIGMEWFLRDGKRDRIWAEVEGCVVCT
ncbi:uncharacterized protein TRIVIDRAFT_92071 [Trichoderma virens Gv29-8]|uniref:Secreted protein n=1 Tax=Hypocrea virens (strain Gv29-8 / FGSC 10586) TaxID=413071 RepID=G9MFP9_HYPVG|nr:uncharacterized protein TRIVIDRAFT_92071 [Trichoderma virens Gv29-8]EHK26721.1 hypothetical protein TRIVIDRAFT_92071 [Trichoderma virens Gv29-8]